MAEIMRMLPNERAAPTSLSCNLATPVILWQGVQHHARKMCLVLHSLHLYPSRLGLAYNALMYAALDVADRRFAGLHHCV